MTKPDLELIGARAREVSRELARTSTESKVAALTAVADALVSDADSILEANAKDIENAESSGMSPELQDRLLLTEERLADLAGSVRGILAQPDPVGEIIEEQTRPNGLKVQRRRIPLGVIGPIYESRPNVTIDMASLCLMSGNAAIMRGGSESYESNLALASLARNCIAGAGIPADAVQFVESKDRAYVEQMLGMKKYIDMLIPRGGAELVRMVAERATMPAITGGIGVCHTYVDRAADLEKAVAIVHNAKVQRPSVCNALDTVLVHAEIAGAFLPSMAGSFWRDGVEIRGDRRTLALLEPVATESNANGLLKAAVDEDFDTEFLGMRAAVRVVDSIDDALDHIEEHGSNHSEAIVTEDADTMDRFLNEVDASAVFANSSTRFNDGGEFGLGAEVAISTDKLHAYGPMGLKEITSYKWVVVGDGQIRS